MTPANNLWYCLGACQIGGTVIDWVVRAEEISFRHAVELLHIDALPSASVGALHLRFQAGQRRNGAPLQPLGI